MTVHIKEGRATIPLWAAVALVITSILAVAGGLALAAEKMNDAQHEAIKESVNAVADRTTKIEKIIEAIPQMQKDIAVILAKIEDKK